MEHLLSADSHPHPWGSPEVNAPPSPRNCRLGLMGKPETFLWLHWDQVLNQPGCPTPAPPSPEPRPVLGGASSKEMAFWTPTALSEATLCLPLLAVPRQCPLWQAGRSDGHFHQTGESLGLCLHLT